MTPCHHQDSPDAEPCAEPAVVVVFAPTFTEDPDEPEHWPIFACTDHAPEVMHELLQTFERADLITCTIDKPQEGA